MSLQTLADQQATRTAFADARRLRSAADSGLGNDRFLSVPQSTALTMCKQAAERLTEAAERARACLADLERAEALLAAERRTVRAAVADLEQAAKAADLAEIRAQERGAL